MSALLPRPILVTVTMHCRATGNVPSSRLALLCNLSEPALPRIVVSIDGVIEFGRRAAVVAGKPPIR